MLALSLPAVNGKTSLSHIVLHSKPADPILQADVYDTSLSGRGALFLRDALLALRSSAESALKVSELGSFRPAGGAALACYHKATEVSAYLLDKEILVKEGGKAGA